MTVLIVIVILFWLFTSNNNNKNKNKNNDQQQTIDSNNQASINTEKVEKVELNNNERGEINNNIKEKFTEKHKNKNTKTKKENTVDTLQKTADSKELLRFNREDYDKKFKYLMKAAKTGNREALFKLSIMSYRLGILYANGDEKYGVVRDDFEAMKWFKRCCELTRASNKMSQCPGYTANLAHEKYFESKIGDMYFDGKDVPQDYTIAKEWYLLAAKKDYYKDGKNLKAYALKSLGDMYLAGVGVEKDETIAASYFIKAAEVGSEEACRNLASMYEFGCGVEKNTKLSDMYAKQYKRLHKDDYYDNDYDDDYGNDYGNDYNSDRDAMIRAYDLNKGPDGNYYDSDGHYVDPDDLY